MRHVATLAVALCVLALVFNGGEASAHHGSAVEATISVSICEGNATFVVRYDPDAEIGGILRFVPRPMVFTKNAESGAWETGDVEALIVAPNSGMEVAVLIPSCDGPFGKVDVLRLRGELAFQFDEATPGTLVLGPIPLIRPDVDDTFGNGGSGIIQMRPDVGDDAF